ncbi:MAG TPA: lipopolysaccharide heptosyltransferase II [Terriglobales bacterium]|nr:lipopolysaccharide heptosyltransferase II [Terriglobales bacterium]
MGAPHLRTPNPPTRVIVRLPNWLGDTVMAVPALRALREGWPDARVLVAGPWAPLLAGQGVADTLVSYPRGWRGRLATADTVRDFRGELAVLLPNSLEAALAARYWGARRRVGFATGGRSALLTDRVRMPSPRAHQVDEYLMLVRHLGLAAASTVPALTPPPADSEPRLRVRALLRDALGESAPPIVGLHLGAEYGPAKLWPAARVIEACRALVAAGRAPVLLGAARDAALAATIAGATGVASLVGKDEPALLPALLSELDALVAGDTGVAHLAAALGTPVVTLFGPTDPALTAPRGTVTTLTHPVPCAPCFYRRCPIEHPCLANITAEQVVEACRKLSHEPVHGGRGG